MLFKLDVRIWIGQYFADLLLQNGVGVDLESRMMAGQLNILVVGQDVLRTNGEVGNCQL